MTNPIEMAETASNALTMQGKILESIDQFYSDDCIFVEPDGSSRSSKAAQHEHLEGFFSNLQEFKGATLHGQAVGDDFSASEWTFEMTAGDGSPIIWNETLVRKWRDGKIVSESYYTQG